MRFRAKMSSMSVSERPADRSPPPEPRYQPLVIVLTAAVAGILADRFWPLPLAAWWTLATAGLVVWIVVADLERCRSLLRECLQVGHCPLPFGRGLG